MSMWSSFLFRVPRDEVSRCEGKFLILLLEEKTELTIILVSCCVSATIGECCGNVFRSLKLLI